MKNLKPGQFIEIHAYKHNGSHHRSWRRTMVIKQEENQVILGNYHAKVLEGDGRNWYTQEPAISFFKDDAFFNIIAMIKKDGIYFYCNIASPALYDNEGLKYIDNDLDIRVTPDFEYVILDEKEYKHHLRRFNYPQDLQQTLRETLDLLQQKILNQELPFNHDYIMALYEEYKNIFKDVDNGKN